VTNRDKLPLILAVRLAAVLVVAGTLALAGMAHALTIVQFAPVQTILTNEIATIEAEPAPGKAELKRLTHLQKANDTLNDSSLSDGAALRLLAARLRGKAYANYADALAAASSNLVSTFNSNYQFVGSLLQEIPESKAAVRAQTQYNALGPIVARLNAAKTSAKAGLLVDTARRRLNAVFGFVASALTVPFPEDLQENTVTANINGVNFRVSADLSTDNIFSAVKDGTNITLFITAIDGTVSSATPVRGLTISAPAVDPGTFRYAIPDQATLTNRVGIYTANETATVATNGAIFISANATEVFGVFTASGDGLTITEGRFRLTLTNAPEQTGSGRSMKNHGKKKVVIKLR